MITTTMLAAQATYREAMEHLFAGRRQQACLSLAYSPIRRRKVEWRPRIPNEIVVFLPQKKLTMSTTTSTDATKKKAGGRKASSKLSRVHTGGWQKCMTN